MPSSSVNEPAWAELKTLAQVVAALSENSGLASTRRRDLISACNSLARLLGRQAHDIPAEIGAVRSLLKGLHPVQGRITRKRLSNIKADLAAALQAVGLVPPADQDSPISAAWLAFLGRADAPHHARGTTRFARFCSARQIEPHAVNDSVLQAFTTYVDARILTNDPERIARDTATNFNVIVKRAGLGFGLLTTARGTAYVTPPLETYPASLQADIARYVKRLEKPDLFSADGPKRTLRPISLRNVRAHLRQILAAAREAGYPPERFQSLSALIDIDVLNGAAEQLIGRNGGKTPASLLNILATLLAIARYHVRASEETINRIAAAKGHVAAELGGSQRSMSPKSQRRMDQFLDDANVARIIALPEQLIRRANRNPGTQGAALDAMVAAAIAFLLACPALRMANLAALNLEEDLSRDVSGKKVSFLVHVAPQKTKGRQAIDAVIEPPLSTVIDHYLKHHRGRLAGEPQPWLFPQRTGGPRNPGHFGELIARRIFEETGIVMNPHLFRHLSGALFLEAHPGEYESVRRLVAHAKIETTTSFYTPQSSRAAFERYGKVLERYRREP